MSCSRSQRWFSGTIAIGRSMLRFVADQGHDVARAGVFDGFMQARKRTDVNHGTFEICALSTLI